MERIQTVKSSAVINGNYRYVLTRRWGLGPVCVFCMLNPSTADAENDDPTIRRCIGFAQHWGYGSLHVVNLYAFRSPNPESLLTSDEPVGDDNDFHIEEAAIMYPRVIAAWGTNAQRERAAEVCSLIRRHRPIWCLGTTAEGFPRHPLYMKADVKPIEYHGGEA